jgi:hypothetical protein
MSGREMKPFETAITFPVRDLLLVVRFGGHGLKFHEKIDFLHAASVTAK